MWKWSLPCLIASMSPSHHFSTDVNECMLEPPCQQLCNNTEGSFVCTCENGFRLNEDGVTCNGMVLWHILAYLHVLSSGDNPYSAQPKSCNHLLDTKSLINNSVHSLIIYPPYLNHLKCTCYFSIVCTSGDCDTHTLRNCCCMNYGIASKFDRELNLAVWQSGLKLPN